MVHPVNLRRVAGVLGGTGLTFAFAAPAMAHSLLGRYESPLPLVVYLAGAAIAVGLSFAFVLLHDTRAETPPLGAARAVPAWLRLGLRAIGILGWLWIVIQTILGGAGDADVASLFLWVFGWVGLAMVSAFLGPAWTWLDPFTTLHDAGAWLLRVVGMSGWRTSPYSERLGAWPAVAGFVFFVWLELVFTGAGSGRTLGAILIGYTASRLSAWPSSGATSGGRMARRSRPGSGPSGASHRSRWIVTTRRAAACAANRSARASRRRRGRRRVSSSSPWAQPRSSTTA
jgi:hypothetical protein